MNNRNTIRATIGGFSTAFPTAGAEWPHSINAPSSGARHGHPAGFSLIEVMIAILILGIAIVGLTQGITTAMASGKESELQTTAALFAAGQIEQLRAEGGILDGQSEGDCGDLLALYRWKQSITAAGIDGLHQVDVIVENARTGKAIYELRTLLFERPDDSSATEQDKTKNNRQQGGRRQ